MWSSNLITSCMRVPLVVGLCIRVCLPRLSWVVVLSILPWYDVFTGCESAVVCRRWVV